MFFLIVIISIIQIILLVMAVLYLVSLDIKILFLIDCTKSYNNWLESRKPKIIGLFSDINFLIKQFYKKIRKQKKKILLGQAFNIFEWGLLFLIKKSGKKFILGYKLAKAVVKELSMTKNMV